MSLRGCLGSVTVSDGVADWEPGLLGKEIAAELAAFACAIWQAGCFRKFQD